VFQQQLLVIQYEKFYIFPAVKRKQSFKTRSDKEIEKTSLDLSQGYDEMWAQRLIARENLQVYDHVMTCDPLQAVQNTDTFFY
jgi:hypothetical protein